MPIDPNASLRALLGGGQNIANSRIALRNKQVQDPLTSHAFEQQVAEENAAEAANQAADPMSQRYAAISKGQNEAAVENVPEIKKLHDEQLAEEMARITAPARTAGEFAVKAAESKAQAQNDALTQLLSAGVAPGQRVSASGVGSVSQAATPRPAAMPAALTTRFTKAQQAARPGMFFGPSAAQTNELEQSVQAMGQQEGLHPQLVQDALSVARANPKASAQQLLQAAEQLPGGALDDNERQQFLSVFSRLR